MSKSTTLLVWFPPSVRVLRLVRTRPLFVVSAHPSPAPLAGSTCGPGSTPDLA